MSVGGISQTKVAVVQPPTPPDRKPPKPHEPTSVAQQRIAAKLDTDGDGALTAAELSALEKSGQGKNGRPAQALFAAQGISTDAQPLRPEPSAAERFGPKTLDALIGSQTAPTAEEVAQRLVGGIDGDADGAFTLAELKDALPGKSGAAKGRGAQAERAFERLDTDKDGKVSVAELTAALRPTAPPPAEEPAPPPADPAAGAPDPVTQEVIDPPVVETFPAAD